MPFRSRARFFEVARPLALAAVAFAGCTDAPIVPTLPPKPSPAPQKLPKDDLLRLNEVQVKATHNSYHLESEGINIPELRYSNAPIEEQLSIAGARSFEFDTRYDPDTRLFKVFHLGIFDDRTLCPTLDDCLAQLKSWSDRNPSHLPLAVMIEPKDAAPLEKDAEEYFRDFERSVLLVWPRESIVTPDDVRGEAKTVREAILTRGWPTLGKTRGKILFFINNRDEWRSGYTRGGNDISKRLMFPEALSMDDPLAAAFVLNDPVNEREKIEAAVRAGFLVRTRADADLKLPGDAEAALASGSHFISTDFAIDKGDGSYFFSIPFGTPARCNPLVAREGCTALDLEDPSRLGPLSP